MEGTFCGRILLMKGRAPATPISRLLFLGGDCKVSKDTTPPFPGPSADEVLHSLPHTSCSGFPGMPFIWYVYIYLSDGSPLLAQASCMHFIGLRWYSNVLQPFIRPLCYMHAWHEPLSQAGYMPNLVSKPSWVNLRAFKAFWHTVLHG